MLGTHLVFLGLLIAGCLVLANAAHQGGVLVHRHGVQAFLPPEKYDAWSVVNINYTPGALM